MTATQSSKLFKIASKYFASQDDATQFVSEIEAVVDNKFEDKKNALAIREFVKDEIAGVKNEISDLQK